MNGETRKLFHLALITSLVILLLSMTIQPVFGSEGLAEEETAAETTAPEAEEPAAEPAPEAEAPEDEAAPEPEAAPEAEPEAEPAEEATEPSADEPSDAEADAPSEATDVTTTGMGSKGSLSRTRRRTAPKRLAQSGGNATGYSVVYVSRVYNGTTTTFTWQLASASNPDAVSHVDIVTCLGNPTGTTAGGTAGSASYGKDPSLSPLVTGWKWDSSPEVGETFTLTFQGDVPEAAGAASWYVKKGNNPSQVSGTATGPSCITPDTSTITIQKETDDSNTEAFDFTTNFDLVTDANATANAGRTSLLDNGDETSIALPHGTYTITENLSSNQVAAGWSLTGTDCGTPDSNGSISVTLGSDDVTCVFTNDFDPPTRALTLTKDDNADPIFIGDNVTYTVTVSNNSETSFFNVYATDLLPAGLEFVSASSDRGECSSSAAEGGTLVTCQLGIVWSLLQSEGEGDSNAVITIVAKGVAEGNHTDTASVFEGVSTSRRLQQVGPIALATATEDTTVMARHNFVPPPPQSADLSIVKTDSGDPVNVGDPLNYTLTVTNTGPNPSGTVTVNDTLPEELEFIAATSATATCTSSPTATTTTVTCINGSLNSGQSFSVMIEGMAQAEGVISNTATVSGQTPDPDLSNNTDTELTTVGAPPPTLGRIVVEKQTVPNGSSDTFSFTGDMTATLSDDTTSELEVGAGTFSVTESSSEGWDLTRIQCLDSDAGGAASSGNVDAATATFNVEAGETVVCVFTNVEEEVKGEVITRPKPPKSDPEVKPRAVTKPKALPATGADPSRLSSLAVLTILAGLALALNRPRRRRGRHEP